MRMSKLLKKSGSLIALLLAAIMLLSACGGADTSSTESKADSADSSQSESVLGETSTEDKIDNASDTQSAAQDTSKQNNAGQNVQTQSNKTTWEKDYLSTIPAAVKAKEIHILMWRTFDEPEQKLVDEFKKRTGIKIRTTITPEQEYTTKLISLISGGDSPDIVFVSTDTFPGVVTKCCLPLDEKVYRLDDPAWYKPYMDCYKVNGRYFSVAMNKSPSCEDTNHMVYYLKSTLKACGISTTPWQLYKQGKWDWEAQNDIVIKASAKGITGLSMHSYDTYMQSTGNGFVKYDGKQFTNNMDNPTVLKSWTNFANVTSSGEVTGWDYKNIAAGRVALFTSIAYQGFKVSKVFRNEKGEPTVQGGIENIECVPIAGPTQSTAYTPVMAKSWANPKGSKNPEGAAYFLRFFLDVSNTDYENLFHNNQIKEVYNTICDRKAKKQITYEKGVVSFTNKDLYKNIVTELKFATPANIKQKLDSHKKTINAPIKQANNALSRIK